MARKRITWQGDAYDGVSLNGYVGGAPRWLLTTELKSFVVDLPPGTYPLYLVGAIKNGLGWTKGARLPDFTVEVV